MQKTNDRNHLWSPVTQRSDVRCGSGPVTSYSRSLYLSPPLGSFPSGVTKEGVNTPGILT